MQQSSATHELEMVYEKACQQVEMICESECARQLRLETLLLEDENEDLHTQLAHDDKRIEDLEQYALDLQEEIRAGAEKLNAVQGHLRMRSREIESLKVIEIAILHPEQNLIIVIGRVKFPVWSLFGFNKATHGKADTGARAVEY